MSKPATPVRRSKVGPGRPGSAGGEIPLMASMEVLTPDPSAPSLATMDVGRSQDFPMPFTGGKPRHSGSAPLTRTRSTDGRRSALLSQGHVHGGTHEVIPLVSTTAKSLSSNHIAPPANLFLLQQSQQQPLPFQQQPQPSPSLSPYASTVGLQASRLGWQGAGAAHAEVGLSQASSMRFNPVTEGDDDAANGFGAGRAQTPLLEEEAETPGARASDMRISRVVVGGSAATVAQRVASAGGSHRRYGAEAESVALSMEQNRQPSQQQQDGQGLEPDGGSASCSRRGTPQGYLGRGPLEDTEAPGTPGSVASGRMGGGGTFFTDLHRSFGDGSRLRRAVYSAGGPGGVDQSQDLTGMMDGEAEGAPGSREDRRPRASTMSSRLNPMQSPTMSEDGGGDDDDLAFAEYAGEEPAPVPTGPSEPGEATEPDPLRPGSAALTEDANPLQTPQDSRLATPLLPTAAAAGGAAPAEVRASLLNVIHDLYVTEPEPPPPPPESEAENEGEAGPAQAEQPSRPTTALSELALPPETGADEDDGGEGEEDKDSVGVLAASRATVAALASRSESQQSKRRSELGEYMTALQERKDESGSRLVELPPDWGVMLERLFRQRRSEFATLQNWMGPRRFEELPINQLPKDHPDPKVEEGLARIRELDSVLNDKLVAALISHRETFPDQWAEQERRRLERHIKGVEEALKRERQKRLRAARISRAVTSLDGPAGSVGGGGASVRGSEASLRSLAEQPSSIYSRLFTLKPEEEALVEAVLQRNDDEGAAINPFDLESAATYSAPATATASSGRPTGASGASSSGAAGGPRTLTVLTPDDDDEDDDDIEIELAMALPSSTAGSACVTPSTTTASMLRPLSARAAERSHGPGHGPGDREELFRPSSALSIHSFSDSRPGTAASVSGASGYGSGGLPAGGLSPLAAAALRGHPVLLRASGTGERGGGGIGGAPVAWGPGGGGSGGLLPSRFYEDPRAAARALRAINARLAAFESEHLWDENGSLADFKSIPQPSVAGAADAPGAAPAASVIAGSAAGRPASPSRSVRSGAGGGGGPAGSVAGVSVTEGGQRDYLREERVAKELSSRERDVDAALRQLKTGEVVRLGEAGLKALVEQCRRLQELSEQRRRIEEAEAAARRAQQQRQMVLEAAAGNGRGGRSPRTPKSITTPTPAKVPAAVAASGKPPISSTSAAPAHQTASSTTGLSAASTPTGGGGGNASRSTPKGVPPAAGGRHSGLSTSADGSRPGAGSGSGSGSASGGRGSGGTQRHNSAGSAGGSGRAHASAGTGGRDGGSGSPASQAASRRASDPASPAAAGSTGAAHCGGPGHSHSGGLSASRASIRASAASTSSSVGAPGSSGSSSTPPRRKPSSSQAAPSSRPGSSSVASGAAAGTGATPSSSVTSAWDLVDAPPLPPPPPPPPPE